MSSAETGRHKIVVRLNQQQLELVDRTMAAGLADRREELLRLALKEYAASKEGIAE
jgi:metal-responsive CopG/Arc/MetJ family transcriptional regulator